MEKHLNSDDYEKKITGQRSIDMGEKLRALVLGSGFASQEHTEALRYCGVEVVGMASRTESVVKEVAAKMGIPHASADWRKSLAELKPEIVDVATPGGTHLEMITAAAEAGCHIYCDKPLATTAEDAKKIYTKTRDAGVKTAFAATARCNETVVLAHELVSQGAIGEVYEAECISHYDWPRLMPYGWSHSLEEGGGRLNNNFTHKMSIILKVLGGEVLEATGESRNDLKRAPVGPRLHDFRLLQSSALTPEEAEKAEWREANADWAYTVLARIGPAGTKPEEGVSVTFRHSNMQPQFLHDYVAFYGREGSIHIEGAYAQGTVHLYKRGKNEWEDLPIPARISDSLPKIENWARRNWTQLAREFVADIQGKGKSDYLTFREGWIFQEIIDIARARKGWSSPGE